ncbi:MAG: HAMP domain-containing histidine kinase [Anaerolineaceae bacterium]|nr:HAMP domain-containing histidine kinase [Anaerolineaceae bacterium]
MSLRLRLTLIYSGLLSGVVILLSIVVYTMVSVVMINELDTNIQHAAEQIIANLRADSLGDMAIPPEVVNIPGSIYYQVWSRSGQLEAYSDNAVDFTSALDPASLDSDEPIFQNAVNQTTPLRVLTVPLMVGDTFSGWLQVGAVQTELHYTQQLLQIVFVISALFAIIVAGIVGWLVTAQALEPLETMAQVATRITGTDDLSQRIPLSPSRNDEIGEVVLTFNQTLVRLERLFTAQRRFLADVSHELRTPLTVIKGNVGLMRMMKELDEESLVSIESEVDRLTRLVGDLLMMAQAETGRLPLMFEAVELDELVFEVFEQMKVLSGGRHVIQIDDIRPVMVTGDRDRLKQVFLNLGSNAIKFTEDGSQITLNLSVSGNWVEVDVIDHGPGIPKEELRYIFERFYRGDKSRTRSRADGGFGLGLPIAYWIVRNHGGRIDVESTEGVGTTFSVWLPISQADVPTQPLT